MWTLFKRCDEAAFSQSFIVGETLRAMRCHLTRHQDLETMSREMDLWVRDAQVQQQRYDDERRKTDVELEPLLIKLQVCHIFVIYYVLLFPSLFSYRSHRLRAKLQPSIDCRSRQRVLHALAMKRFYFSFYAKYQTNINKQLSDSCCSSDHVIQATPSTRDQDPFRDSNHVKWQKHVK